jgi:predicted DNA-binding transcriptional regulator
MSDKIKVYCKHCGETEKSFLYECSFCDSDGWIGYIKISDLEKAEAERREKEAKELEKMEQEFWEQNPEY